MQSTYKAQPISKAQLAVLHPVKQYFKVHPKQQGGSITGSKMGNWVLTSTRSGNALVVLLQLPPSTVSTHRFVVYHYVDGNCTHTLSNPVYSVQRCIHTAQQHYNQVLNSL